MFQLPKPLNRRFPLLILLVIFLAIGGGCKKDTSQNSNSHTTSKSITSFTDARDGNTYTTIKIGTQVWMAENLRYKIKGSWINPDHLSIKYGRLYNVAMTRGLCPEGWHLPSDTEWNLLEQSLGMAKSENITTGWRGTHGKSMKSENGWASGLNGTNTSGFNGLPAGFYNEGKGFDGTGVSTGFWTDADKDDLAWMRWLGGPLESVNRFSEKSSSGFSAVSCRCVKD